MKTEAERQDAHHLIKHFRATHPEIELYLGGSRRVKEMFDLVRADNPDMPQLFQSVSSTTDWDYYVTYSDEVFNKLLEYGFCETTYAQAVRQLKKDILDPNVGMNLAALDDYEFDTEVVTIVHCENVQIVLRKDANFYKRVFESIDHDFYHDLLWKSSPTLVAPREYIRAHFNQLFQTAHAFESK